MKATAVMEIGKDGFFSCYMEDEFPDFGIIGSGETAQEAKEDFICAYEEIKEMLQEEGKEVPELEFEWRYDMKSFFNYFNFLNISKVAERAGINPSLMRKYVAGLANPSENQYKKLNNAVKDFSRELISAEL